MRKATCLIVLWIFFAGCNSPTTSSVTGSVNFEGKPLTGGTVTFFPTNGEPVQTVILPDGSYRIDRVALGEAIIVVVPPPSEDDATAHKRIKRLDGEPAPPPPPKPSLMPQKYSDNATSNLRYTVKSGDNRYDLDLKK